MQCAERETLEETGLQVKGRKVVHVTNDVFSDLGKHYITIFVVCEMLDQGAQPAVSSSLQHTLTHTHTE
jgi:8-oxo-dGTP diphosphatase